MGEDFKAGVYKHFKGGHYQVLGLAGLSDDRIMKAIADTPAAMEFFKIDCPHFVVYISLYTDKGGPFIQVRSIHEFNQEVEWPDGHTGPRFEYLGDSSI